MFEYPVVTIVEAIRTYMTIASGRMSEYPVATIVVTIM
jgi:hypothetical protein